MQGTQRICVFIRTKIQPRPDESGKISVTLPAGLFHQADRSGSAHFAEPRRRVCPKARTLCSQVSAIAQNSRVRQLFAALECQGMHSRIASVQAVRMAMPGARQSLSEAHHA